MNIDIDKLTELTKNNLFQQGIIELVKRSEVKPKQKIIDLSKVGSDIDMEFSNDGQEHHFKRNIGKLLNITPTKGIPFYSTVLNDEFYKCRIRENHWHNWNGGECPLPEGLEIRVQYRDKQRVEGRSRQFLKTSWKHSADVNNDIIAFKVLGTADDARYEWQKEKEE